MDYNEVRERRRIKKNGGNVGSYVNRTPKKRLDVRLILLAVIVALLVIIGVIFLVKGVMPKQNEDINPMDYQTTMTPNGEEGVIATPEPTPQVRIGTKQSIPEDVWSYMNGRSWKENPNVGYEDLMYLTMPYYDFNYEIQTGHMVIAADLADEVLNIFAELFDIQYPVEIMEPIDAYFDGLTEQLDTPDRNSMGHNNTSAFYYRVVSGSGNLSQHAYGRAIDLNPKTNPWVSVSGSVSPRNATKYANRRLSAANTDFTNWSGIEQAAFIGNDTRVYDVFSKYGWEWGGEIWQSSYYDYQHFQKRK